VKASTAGEPVKPDFGWRGEEVAPCYVTRKLWLAYPALKRRAKVSRRPRGENQNLSSKVS
jgi:hypothetical protein